ncbi:hypothetical protein K438DRAFT_1937906 [Mycena galopus ATCC 62051]|nr:hypothetical protein K438DRAFT_1937906 [Mycena galopus ATCC 62051]
MLFSISLPFLAFCGSVLAAPRHLPKAVVAPSTIVGSSISPKSTAASFSNNPAKAVTFERRDLTLGALLVSLQAQVCQAFAAPVASATQATFTTTSTLTTTLLVTTTITAPAPDATATGTRNDIDDGNNDGLNSTGKDDGNGDGTNSGINDGSDDGVGDTGSNDGNGDGNSSGINDGNDDGVGDTGNDDGNDDGR